jgi:hypothetical protein
LLGLKWQDIDMNKGVLQVRRSLTRMPTGQGYKEMEPKMKKSRRSIVLTSFAIESLKKHRARQLEAKIVAGDAWEDHDYVFCSPIGKHLHPGHDVLEQLKKLLRVAGLPEIRFHDLRHSTATLLLSQGVHPKVVQEILGHSAISMTLDIYSHVLPTMQKDAIGGLNNFFGTIQGNALSALSHEAGQPCELCVKYDIHLSSVMPESIVYINGSPERCTVGNISIHHTHEFHEQRFLDATGYAEVEMI